MKKIWLGVLIVLVSVQFANASNSIIIDANKYLVQQKIFDENRDDVYVCVKINEGSSSILALGTLLKSYYSDLNGEVILSKQITIQSHNDPLIDYCNTSGYKFNKTDNVFKPGKYRILEYDKDNSLIIFEGQGIQRDSIFYINVNL